MKFIRPAHIENSWRKSIRELTSGELEFVAPNGDVTLIQGARPGPRARFEVKDWNVLHRVMARGDIGLGEEYIAGSWDSDDIEQLISLFLLNWEQFERFADGNFLNRLAFVINNMLIRRNSLAGAGRNIRAHYDVGNDFYRIWLDSSMTYSSAIYSGIEPLEVAQERKYNRILSKAPKERASLLEIGCGWGGFAEVAAQRGHAVTGITISPAQCAFARDRLKGAADIRLEDYRRSNGTYDMVVSIEMFEAVGESYWPRYFAILAERLKQHGLAVVQTITIRDELFKSYRARSDFIRQYVFPGGMLPSLARFRHEAEKAGLKVRDVFHFGKDYARTLREWSRRMSAGSNVIAALGHDDHFFRNWKFYLGICAAAFEVGRTDVVQIELVKS